MLHERESEQGRHQGSLVWDGEHYQMIELGPDAIEGRISCIREALEFAETLTLVPAEALGEIKEDAKPLFEDLDAAYSDTVLAVKVPFRIFASEAAQIQTTWSQVSVSCAAKHGKVTAGDYFDVGNTLAKAKYFFTQLNVGNFFHELKKSGWTLTPTISALIDLLARPANEPQGVLNLLSDLAKLGWPLKPDDESSEALFTAIFAAFKKAQPDRDLQSTANLMFGRVQEFLRSRSIPHFRDRLLQSTSMKSVAAMAEEGHQIQSRLVTHIGQALGRALEKAGAT